MPLLPPWYGVLQMSEKVGIPAWEIAPETPKLLWYIRARYIWSTKSKIQKKELDKQKKLMGR